MRSALGYEGFKPGDLLRLSEDFNDKYDDALILLVKSKRRFPAGWENRHLLLVVYSNGNVTLGWVGDSYLLDSTEVILRRPDEVAL